MRDPASHWLWSRWSPVRVRSLTPLNRLHRADFRSRHFPVTPDLGSKWGPMLPANGARSSSRARPVARLKALSTASPKSFPMTALLIRSSAVIRGQPNPEGRVRHGADPTTTTMLPP
jgi:hypothetical protein